MVPTKFGFEKKILPPKKFSARRKFFVQKLLGLEKFWVNNIFLGSIKCFGPEKFLSKKSFGPTKFSGQTNFRPGKILGPKRFWSEKNWSEKL